MFDWFRQHSRAGTHEIGQMFGGVLFYDHEAWPLSVPIIMGTCKLDLLKAIKGMPEPILRSFSRDTHSLERAAKLWAECIDYGSGMDDLDKTLATDGNARGLLFSGDDKLRATVELILRKPPSQEVVMTARFATEMFLKGYIAARKGLSEAEAKKLWHHLDRALEACLKIAPHSELRDLGQDVLAFPDVEERYNASNRPLRDLWDAYAIAQRVGATVVRELSGRDCRSGLQVS